MQNADNAESEKFPNLYKLAKSLQSYGLGGYYECYRLQSQSTELQNQYLRLLGHSVPLFHKQEKKSIAERAKFLKRLTRAKDHLLNVYFQLPLGVDAEELDLSRHPSCGMRSLANKTYGLLERHWKCHCIQQASRSSGLREARLSLIIHRRLASEVAAQGITAYSCPQAKFEILLPVCQDNAEWKVTNVEVVKLW